MPIAFQLLKRWIEIADASCAPRGIRFRAKVTAVECLCVQMKEYFFPRPKPSLSQAAQSVSEILIMPNLEFDCNAVKRERERERKKQEHLCSGNRSNRAERCFRLKGEKRESSLFLFLFFSHLVMQQLLFYPSFSFFLTFYDFRG